MSSPDPERERSQEDERHRLFGRRLRGRGPSPAERLALLVEERRREFDEQTARFEQTLAELEQRELFLSDTKASIERLLRLGSKELDAREAELVRLMDDLAERETRVQALEEELAQRRTELGAVELKRLVVEQREGALEAREAAVAAAEEQLAAATAARGTAAPGAQMTVAFVPAAAYGLVEIPPLACDPGDPVVVAGEEYVLLRSGPSPLPDDARRCAYLVRAPRRPMPPGGSS